MATPSALILVMVQRFLFRKEEEASALFDRVQQQYSYMLYVPDILKFLANPSLLDTSLALCYVYKEM